METPPKNVPSGIELPAVITSYYEMAREIGLAIQEKSA